MIYPSGLYTSVLRSRASRALAAMLSIILVAVTSYVAPSMANAHDKQPLLPKILIFPFTNNSGSANDSLTSVVSGNVRLDIDALGDYRSTGYSVLHPSLQRALNIDNTVALADLAAPAATPDRADKIANLVGTPYFLIGAVDSITVDPTSGEVSVALDGSFYNTSTGAVIKQANVTGTATPVSKDYDPDQLQTSAIANGAGQLVAALIGPRFVRHYAETGGVATSHAKANYGAGLMFILALALTLVIVNNHGGHSGGSSSSSGGTTSTTTTTTGPPAPP
jgi:hypothetical protein